MNINLEDSILKRDQWYNNNEEMFLDGYKIKTGISEAIFAENSPVFSSLSLEQKREIKNTILNVIDEVATHEEYRINVSNNELIFCKFLNTIIQAKAEEVAEEIARKAVENHLYNYEHTCDNYYD